MKLFITVLIAVLCTASAFQPTAFVRKSTSLQGFDLSGNDWKPDGDKQMGSTDVGDYFPEDWDPNAAPDFTEGMGGSSAMLGGDRGGPELPGMENLGGKNRSVATECRTLCLYLSMC